MSFELLERAAQTLEPVHSEVVFLGGASIVLWITDPAAPAPRPTKDVDVVVEVTSRTAFHAFEERLRSLGFNEDQEDGIICRWRHRDSDLILDAMPADASILGASRDFGDMIALIDGREELPGEVQASDPDVRAYLASELKRLSAHVRFREGVSGALRADFASQARAEAVVLPRIGQLIGEPQA